MSSSENVDDELAKAVAVLLKLNADGIIFYLLLGSLFWFLLHPIHSHWTNFSVTSGTAATSGTSTALPTVSTSAALPTVGTSAMDVDGDGSAGIILHANYDFDFLLLCIVAFICLLFKRWTMMCHTIGVKRRRSEEWLRGKVRKSESSFKLFPFALSLSG